MVYQEIEVIVLGSAHKIKCKEGSVRVLLEAADILDRMSTRLKTKYPKSDNQSLLLMAALSTISRNEKHQKLEKRNLLRVGKLIATINDSFNNE